jgi:hypothetical protein
LPGVAAPRPAVEYLSAGVIVRYVLVPGSFRPSLGLPWKEHMAGPFGVDGAPTKQKRLRSGPGFAKQTRNTLKRAAIICKQTAPDALTTYQLTRVCSL